MADDVLADGMEKMCFAEADAAVEEKRIVGFAWRFSHSLGGGKSKIIVVADHECLEGVLRIEIDFVVA